MKVEVTTNPLDVDEGGSEWSPISRRSLLTSAPSAVALAPVAVADELHKPKEIPGKAGSPQTAVSFDLMVNGRVRQLTIDPRTTLLDALREHLGLTGAKKGCDHGQCGACTVLIEGSAYSAV